MYCIYTIIAFIFFFRKMPEYKIFYFPFRALAEGARLLLAYGQEGFEDVRITNEEWPSYKPS